MTGPRTSSASARASARCWPPWLATAPRLVAESLAGVSDPLAAWLRPGPAAAPAEVAAALAHAMLPPAAAEAPPEWLRPDQQLSFRRALAAVRQYRGALLADGVGSGKSWIALAVAYRLDPAGTPIVVAPATLRSQWEQVSRRTGVPIRFHSHEAASRGRSPPPDRGGVIVDESHRFRNPLTRRYEVLARWCVGRTGLLLSATPAVNTLEDVAHQLLLLIRDDALAWAGARSLRAALDKAAPGALCHLLVTGEDRTGSLPARRSTVLTPGTRSREPLESLLHGIRGLRLSSDPAIAGLIRVSLLLALASSPAAIAAALRRYLLLLLHARDAQGAGAVLTRNAIRRMVGTCAEQLVFWPLAEGGNGTSEVETADLEPVERLESLARAWSDTPDDKVRALRAAVADERPSLVFTTALPTVAYIRRQFGRRGLAWCSGLGGGLDEMAVDREQVLDWFRDAKTWSHPTRPPPAVLITTDVAAEGLDLRRVERVVHYDLPWTAVRLEQRDGRALRLGLVQREVEQVRFLPPPGLAAVLEQERILERKSALPESLGLGPALDAPWRARAAIAARWQGCRGVEGAAAFFGPEARGVAGYRLRYSDGSSRSVVLARSGRGWSDDPALVAAILEEARQVDSASGHATRESGRIIRHLAPVVRATLRAANAAALGATRATREVRKARARLLRLAHAAARARRVGRLRDCERGLALLGRGLTAGEEAEIGEWAKLEEPAFLARLSRISAEPSAPVVTGVALIGVIAVEQGGPCR